MEELVLLERMADAVQETVRTTPLSEFGEPGGMGASGRPAKQIDRLAEQRILDVLDGSDVDLNVCSEEVGWIDNDAERTLVVDPIDGTLNAVLGIPFYCVSLAVARTGLGDVDLGLVRNLLTGTTYTAVRGEGAHRDGDAIAARAFDAERAVRSPIVAPEGTEGLPGLAQTAPYVRGLGAAALEMSLVAQGSLDLYIHLKGGLRIIDIAAGTLIVEEAGGTVVTPEGRRPELGFDVSERTNLLAVGDETALRTVGVPA